MTVASLKSSTRQGGMTLLEMLVSVTVMVLIVFGLTAAFNQTQRIFVTGLSQTDNLEGGRTALDLIRRDIEPTAVWQYITTNTVVAAIGMERDDPMSLTLPASGTTTNVLEKFFLLRQSLTGQPGYNFSGVGYRVLNLFTNVTSQGNAIDNTPPYIGTLYRYSSANVQPFIPPRVGSLQPLQLPSFVLGQPDYLVSQGYLTEVVEGVVHFQVNFYDRTGNLMYFGEPGSGYTGYPTPPFNVTQATPANIARAPNGVFLVLYGSPPPAFVEIELGVLDPPAVEQIKALFPNGGGANFNSFALSTFLQNHTANIHYYRTQVPIRTSLTAALP